VSVRCETRPVERTFARPVRLGKQQAMRRCSLLLKLTDMESGRYGFGEVAPLPMLGSETLEEAKTALEKFAAGKMGEAAFYKDYPAAASGYSMAQENLHPRLQATEEALPVAGLLLEPSAAQALALVAEGYQTLKLKIGGGKAAEEVAAVRAMCEALPAQVRLRLDANGQLSEADFTTWCETLAGEGRVEFFEQPLPPDKLDAMRTCHERYGVAIALDESVVHAQDVAALLAQWPSLFVIKPALLGDWRSFCAMIEGSEKVAQRMVYSAAFETAVGYEMGLRLAAHRPSRYALGFGTNRFFTPDDPFTRHPNAPMLQAHQVSLQAMERLWDAAS